MDVIADAIVAVVVEKIGIAAVVKIEIPAVAGKIEIAAVSGVTIAGVAAKNRLNKMKRQLTVSCSWRFIT